MNTTIIISLTVFIMILIIFYININIKIKNTFPKIIFQTWKSKTVIPNNMYYWMNTWKKYNKKFKYYIYDDNDNRNFIKNNFNWFLNTYDSYPKTINRVDAVRYFFLYKYGGIYADMDFECLKPFDNLLTEYNNYDVIIGSMRANDFQEHDIPNAIMISKPKCNFWLVVMHFLILNINKESVEEQTGPIMLKQAYNYYINNEKTLDNHDWYKQLLNINHHNHNKNTCIVKLKEDVLYPISWDTDRSLFKQLLNINDYTKLTKYINDNYPESYAVTYWTHTW